MDIDVEFSRIDFALAAGQFASRSPLFLLKRTSRNIKQPSDLSGLLVGGN